MFFGDEMNNMGRAIVTEGDVMDPNDADDDTNQSQVSRTQCLLLLEI